MLLSYTKEITNGIYKADKKCKEVEICQLLILKGHTENERQKKFFSRWANQAAREGTAIPAELCRQRCYLSWCLGKVTAGPAQCGRVRSTPTAANRGAPAPQNKSRMKHPERWDSSRAKLGSISLLGRRVPAATSLLCLWTLWTGAATLNSSLMSVLYNPHTHCQVALGWSASDPAICSCTHKGRNGFIWRFQTCRKTEITTNCTEGSWNFFFFLKLWAEWKFVGEKKSLNLGLIPEFLIIKILLLKKDKTNPKSNWKQTEICFNLAFQVG